MKKVVVIIPTLNEAENIEQRIRAVSACNTVSTIIVVDDSSTDATPQIVTGLQSENPNLILIARTSPKNFSQSYREGFARALAEGADVLIQMDADGSHDERYIDAMVLALDQSDFAIGSRYGNGGGIEQWDAIRRLLSRSANLYAKLLLSIPYHDLTGGYNAWKREVLESIDFSRLSNKGYVFQIWLKWNAHKNNFTGTEVPIIFTERRKGKSKFNFQIILETIREIFKMSLEKND